MAIIEKHPAGTFSWIELSTSDQKAAKTFYTSLFGWSVVDSPMGESAEHGTYTMFKIEGLDVAAAYTTMPDEVKMGVPPHWNLYIATDNADKTAAHAKELGATIYAGPMDVMSYGRMAVIADPTGAVFSIWQPKSHIGIRRSNQPGAFCWADLNTPDDAKDKAFYTSLFGWKIAAGEGGGDYLHIENDGKPIGGVPTGSMRDPKVPPCWLIYLQVEDCAAITAKAKDLGANILMGNMHMEHVGNFTVMADPQGAVFAVYQPVH
jgi:predicted enzyme related to lactoylglutathione lyase